MFMAGLLLLSGSQSRAETSKPSNRGRIYFLDITGRKMLSVNDDGSDLKTLLAGLKQGPDGIAVDTSKGHIYWTSMGEGMKDDGSVDRVDVNGRNITTIVPPGGTFTPK